MSVLEVGVWLPSIKIIWFFFPEPLSFSRLGGASFPYAVQVVDEGTIHTAKYQISASISEKNQIILIEGSHTLTSDHDTTTLGSRHGRRAAMSNSLPITASNASI